MKFAAVRFIPGVTVIAMLCTGLAAGSVGVDRYLSERAAAEAAVVHTRSSVIATEQHALKVSNETAALTASAQKALEAATGKTLDNTAPTAVQTAINQLNDALQSAQRDSEARVSAATDTIDSIGTALAWPPRAIARLKSVVVGLVTDGWNAAKTALDQALKSLTEAQAAWQAEQDRIAAEAAAAAARRAAASGSRSATNQLGIDDSATPVVGGDVESYLAQLEPRARVSWDPDLCSGSHICGITTLGAGTPVIALDPDQRARYLTHVGLYVLVHEAAHARSWYRYGSMAALGAASVAVTGIAPSGPNDVGRAAIEYMADCATIVKLGYSMGTYTSSCTPDQLAEAATYW